MSSSFSGSVTPGSMPFISGEVSVPRYPKRISLRRRDSCKMSSASKCTVVYLTLSKSNMSFRYWTIWCCKKRKVYSQTSFTCWYQPPRAHISSFKPADRSPTQMKYRKATLP